MVSRKPITSYKDLRVWQKSILLVNYVYLLTKEFPEEERYGMISQMRRSSCSIPVNIAEGHSSISRKEYLRFVFIAYRSGSELETWIVISKMQNFIPRESYANVDLLLKEVMSMLVVLKKKLKQGL